MTNQQAFETWFTECYGSLVGVAFDRYSESYSVETVDLAWKAWCAAKIDVFRACGL